MPQYANAATARWVVTKVTAQDNQGDTLTLTGAGLSRFHANLAATELADSTPPTYDSLMFASVEQRPYVYDNGVNGLMTYYIEVLDAQSGFWRGSLTLQGPGGQTARGTFALTYSPTAVSFTVAGAVDGVSAAYVDAGFNCVQAGAAAISGDTVSVPMTVFQDTASCPVAGIAVVDGAGDVALYGSEYGAPSPGVTIAQVPDTPPVITSASVSPSSVPESASAQTVTLTVNIGNVIAPVNAIVTSLYDSSGNQVQASGGVFNPSPAVGSGPQTLTFTVPAALAPGTYTASIILTDIGGMESIYGPAPGGQSMPGGPLQLTVISS